MPFVNLREWEVRAYLEGRLSKIVRPVKPQPLRTLPHEASIGDGFRVRHAQGWRWMPKGESGWQQYVSDEAPYSFGSVMAAHCPFGKPGDVLVGREAWSPDATSMYPCPKVWYRADGPIESDGIHVCPQASRGSYGDCLACWEDRNGKFRWRSAATMPAWASRIRPTLLDVSVKLARDVTEEEAREMGIEGIPRSRQLYPTDDYLYPFKRWLTSAFGPAAYDGWVWVGSVGRES